MLNMVMTWGYSKIIETKILVGAPFKEFTAEVVHCIPFLCDVRQFISFPLKSRHDTSDAIISVFFWFSKDMWGGNYIPAVFPLVSGDIMGNMLEKVRY